MLYQAPEIRQEAEDLIVHHYASAPVEVMEPTPDEEDSDLLNNNMERSGRAEIDDPEVINISDDEENEQSLRPDSAASLGTQSLNSDSTETASAASLSSESRNSICSDHSESSEVSSVNSRDSASTNTSEEIASIAKENTAWKGPATLDELLKSDGEDQVAAESQANTKEDSCVTDSIIIYSFSAPDVSDHVTPDNNADQPSTTDVDNTEDEVLTEEGNVTQQQTADQVIDVEGDEDVAADKDVEPLKFPNLDGIDHDSVLTATNGLLGRLEIEFNQADLFDDKAAPGNEDPTVGAFAAGAKFKFTPSSTHKRDVESDEIQSAVAGILEFLKSEPEKRNAYKNESSTIPKKRRRRENCYINNNNNKFEVIGLEFSSSVLTTKQFNIATLTASTDSIKEIEEGHLPVINRNDIKIDKHNMFQTGLVMTMNLVQSEGEINYLLGTNSYGNEVGIHRLEGILTTKDAVTNSTVDRHTLTYITKNSKHTCQQQLDRSRVVEAMKIHNAGRIKKDFEIAGVTFRAKTSCKPIVKGIDKQNLSYKERLAFQECSMVNRNMEDVEAADSPTKLFELLGKIPGTLKIINPQSSNFVKMNSINRWTDEACLTVYSNEQLHEMIKHGNGFLGAAQIDEIANDIAIPIDQLYSTSNTFHHLFIVCPSHNTYMISPSSIMKMILQYCIKEDLLTTI